MASFYYKATSMDGKVVEGFLDAGDETLVLAKLRDMGYLPIRVGSSEDKKSIFSMSFQMPWNVQRVSTRDLLLFSQELTTLLKSGMPLDRSLAILSELSENALFRETVQKVLNDIKGGKSMAEAMAEHPRIFPKLYSNMVKAGEASGALTQVIERVMEFLKASEELRNHIGSALIYPALLGMVGVGSVCVLVIFVIPEFAKVFSDVGVAIPLPMRIMMAISDFFTNYWWAVLAGLAAGYLYFRRWLGTEKGRLAWDTRILTIPLVGKVLQKVEIARFARTLGTLLHSAVPLLQALAIVKDTLGNKAIANTMDPIRTGVKKGEGLTHPIQSSGVFPPLAIHLLRVGEESGKLDTMLLQIADTYDADVRQSIQRLISLFEPLMILVMGIVIGTMVVSMLWSIFSINDVPF